jgi:hypothetical protein
MTINEKAKAYLSGLSPKELHQMLLIGGNELWQVEELALAIADELESRLSDGDGSIAGTDAEAMKTTVSSARGLIEVRGMMKQENGG